MALTKSAYLRLSATIVLAFSIVLTTSNFIRPSRALVPWGVSIFDFAFNPQTLEIYAGNPVNWTNNDGVIYTLWFVNDTDQSTYLMSPPIAPGELWAYTFTQTMTIRYYCFERLWLIGFIRVKFPGDATGDDFVDISDFAILGWSWFQGPTDPRWDSRTDFNHDNFIDISDFGVLGYYWFKGP